MVGEYGTGGAWRKTSQSTRSPICSVVLIISVLMSLILSLGDKFEERRAHAKEDGGGFEDGVAAVRRIKRASMRSIACCESFAVRRTRLGVAGGSRLDSAYRWRYSAAAGVVAVVALQRADAIEGRGASL